MLISKKAGRTYDVCANPFYQKITGRTPRKTAKRVLTILAFIFLLIFLWLGFPHIKTYLDSKGYVIQSPIYKKTQGEKTTSQLPFQPPDYNHAQEDNSRRRLGDNNKTLAIHKTGTGI